VKKINLRHIPFRDHCSSLLKRLRRCNFKVVILGLVSMLSVFHNKVMIIGQFFCPYFYHQIVYVPDAKTRERAQIFSARKRGNVKK